MQVNSAAEVAQPLVDQSLESSRSRAADMIAAKANDASQSGLSTAMENSPALSLTRAASAATMLDTEAVNDSSFDAQTGGMSQADYDKALDMAKLASRAYDGDDFALAETGMNLFGGIKDIKNQDFSTDNYQEIGSTGNYIDWWGGKDQGLDYKVFENTETGDVVLAFRGTEPLSLEDWVEDAEQVLGNSEQYEAAINLARDLQSQLDSYNAANGTDKQLTFTGHSLGGGLATAAALATGNEAFAFDAAGLSQGTIDANNLNVDYADRITNFNVQGDFLSDKNEGLLGTRQYGDTVWLEGVNDRADFGGWLIPDWTQTAKLAESILNHAWHVFTYQLENKNFA
jgi:hypothetical protein